VKPFNSILVEFLSPMKPKSKMRSVFNSPIKPKDLKTLKFKNLFPSDANYLVEMLIDVLEKC